MWAGRSVTALPATIRTESPLYIHQGTFERVQRKVHSTTTHRATELTRQGIGPTSLKGHPLYLVYRLEQLVPAKQIASIFGHDRELWELRGNSILGVQIDFDSPTGRLDAYVDFLDSLKRELGTSWKLSVTGLADWAYSGEQQQVSRLLQSVDEVVFQLYDGRAPVSHLERYLDCLRQLGHRYKVGVLPAQHAAVYQKLITDPNFNGVVIFGEPV